MYVLTYSILKIIWGVAGVTPLFMLGKGSTERLSNLTNDTQLGSGGVGLPTLCVPVFSVSKSRMTNLVVEIKL